MIEPVKYILTFNSSFYNPIMEEIKTSTIRANSKPLRVGDICYGYFPDIQTVLFLLITDHYAKKVYDLNKDDALAEGYLHEDLLKKELKNIYSDLEEDDYVYIYKFKGLSVDEESHALLEQFLEQQKNNNPTDEEE